MSCTVVDTNVVLVANGQHDGVSKECVATCARRLQTIMQEGKLALDDRYHILSEYLKKTTPKKGSRPGDMFVKWAVNSKANATKIDRVALLEHSERGFESFPDHPELRAFDPPDRVFVAVACAHGASPPILQAADSKWLGWDAALKARGVTVDFLCQADIKKFRTNKGNG